MVLITDDPGGGDSSVKGQENGPAVEPRSLLTLVTVFSPSGSGNGDDNDSLKPSVSSESEESSCWESIDIENNDFCNNDNDDDDDDDDDDDVYQEFEEFDFDSLPDLPTDNQSLWSDDSFYPPDDPDELTDQSKPGYVSFFKACKDNNSIIVKVMIRQGVTEEEVAETDKNKRSGLIWACYNGFVDVVMALATCPHLDVNWQDNEGNTALMTAAQAGHVMISNYLLNYFSGLELERRNCHGFTALMKAAMQGRAEVVRSLMMSGCDVEAVDYGRQKTPREWALFTGRHETAALMARLLDQPVARQFCESFCLEWPQLQDLVAAAHQPRSVWQRLADACCSVKLSNRTEPQEDGVLEHMVHVTTGLASPFLAPAVRTVAPESPPCVGKRRYAVQEILRRQRLEELKGLGPERLRKYKRMFQNSRVLLVPKKQSRRASLQPPAQLVEAAGLALESTTLALRRSSLLPLHMMRRASVRPGLVVPKVRLCKAPAPSFIPDAERRGSADVNSLHVPRWNYKAIREERRRREEEDRMRVMMSQRRRDSR